MLPSYWLSVLYVVACEYRYRYYTSGSSVFVEHRGLRKEVGRSCMKRCLGYHLNYATFSLAFIMKYHVQSFFLLEHGLLCRNIESETASPWRRSPWHFVRYTLLHFQLAFLACCRCLYKVSKILTIVDSLMAEH